MSHRYFILADNNMIRVFTNLFMKTIDIGGTTIENTVKRKQHGAFRHTYMRGKQPSKSKIEKDTIEVFHRHIRSFPKSEYSR